MAIIEVNDLLKKYKISEKGHVVLKQCIWIAILYIVAKVLFNKAVRNITVNGG